MPQTPNGPIQSANVLPTSVAAKLDRIAANALPEDRDAIIKAATDKEHPLSPGPSNTSNQATRNATENAEKMSELVANAVQHSLEKPQSEAKSAALQQAVDELAEHSYFSQRDTQDKIDVLNRHMDESNHAQSSASYGQYSGIIVQDNQNLAGVIFNGMEEKISNAGYNGMNVSPPPKNTATQGNTHQQPSSGKSPNNR